MSEKIPKQLYLVLKHQHNGEDPLGFIHAYEPNSKGFVKKKITQDQWAYLSRYYESSIEFNDTDKLYWIRGWTWENIPANELEPGSKFSSKKVFIDKPIEAVCQPRILDNEPLEGFKILKSVSRYTTSNKLWRILDPRGFQLEVSTDNLEDLLMDTTVIKGDIVGKCVWVANKRIKFVGDV